MENSLKATIGKELATDLKSYLAGENDAEIITSHAN